MPFDDLPRIYRVWKALDRPLNIVNFWTFYALTKPYWPEKIHRQAVHLRPGGPFALAQRPDSPHRLISSDAQSLQAKTLRAPFFAVLSQRAAPLSTPCGTTHTGQPPTVSCKRWRHDPPYRPQHLPTVAFVTDTYIFGMRVSHGAHHAAQNTFRLSRPGRVDTAPAFLHFSTSSLGIAAFSRAAYPTPALIAPLSAPAPPQTVYTPCPHSVWARRTPTTARPTLQLPRIFPHRPVCVAAPHIRKTARRSRPDCVQPAFFNGFTPDLAFFKSPFALKKPL
ncbi:hypothetical protein C8J57DRAFT_1608080 [Mycena rebaudengoi]|nr:hypothetical protein C8J57DRAFT_1608080 [Mycena rebaudengoi]